MTARKKKAEPEEVPDQRDESAVEAMLRDKAARSVGLPNSERPLALH